MELVTINDSLANRAKAYADALNRQLYSFDLVEFAKREVEKAQKETPKGSK